MCQSLRRAEDPTAKTGNIKAASQPRTRIAASVKAMIDGRVSINEYCFTADKTPTGMPTVAATIMAQIPKVMEMGAQATISSVTGALVRKRTLKSNLVIIPTI